MQSQILRNFTLGAEILITPRMLRVQNAANDPKSSGENF